MPEAKNKFQKIKKSYLQVIGVFLLILFAALLLWFNNSTSMQAEPALIAQVYFDGEYRIEDGPWQKIVKGEHIPATQGDVTLRGNFHMLTPNGEYVGVYRGDIPIAFYTDQVLKAEPGGELTLTLNMRNSIPICGWDFRLYLPHGVSVVTERDEYDEPVYGISLPSRQAAADQAPETEICADGSLLIISTSAKKNFKGK